MSNFITNGSEYNGKESVDIIVRPLKEEMTPQGIRVVDSMGAGSVKLNFFGKLTKLLMPYADGWQGGSGAPKKQKKMTLSEFKAETSYSKQDYKNTILETIVNRGGVSQNDIDGTLVHQTELEVFNNGIQYDIWRNFWLGDTSKRHTSAGTYPDGSTTYAIGDPDKYYNNVDGIWKSIFGAAAPFASATEDQIRRITIANGAVAQVDTVTLTGTGGTANITVKDKNYLATFATSLTVTAANFVTAYAAELLQRNVLVESSGADLTFTSTIAGVSMGTIAIANVTTNLAGSVANDVANVEAADLTTDEAVATFKSMYRNASKEQRSIKPELRYYVTESMFFNYEDTLQSGGTEQARTQLVDGIERYTYNGIPILPMPIDTEIASDFEGAYPHRAILSTPQNMALVVAVGTENFAETRMWFNPDENENRQRTQFEMGADFVLPELMTVAY